MDTVDDGIDNKDVCVDMHSRDHSHRGDRDQVPTMDPNLASPKRILLLRVDPNRSPDQILVHQNPLDHRQSHHLLKG